MDPSTYHDLWVNLATNSPFLAWMIYSYVQTNKQLEQTRAENRTERIEMQNQQRADEERIRNRFEMVISDLNTDRRHLVEGFSNRIDSLERGQKKIFAILEPLKDQIQEIRVKEQRKRN